LHSKKHFVLAGNAEHTFERNDNEDLATVIQARNGRIRSRVVHRELGERAVRVKALAVRHAELAGENGDRKRKREGGENGDRDRKGGDRAQQQAAGREGGRAGDVEDKRKAGSEGGRAGDVEDKRKAGSEGGQSSGRARGAAARRRRGQDDAATIAATANISRFSSVRDRVEKANGMTVIQAIRLNIYTLRTLRSDESAGYIALVRTSDRNPDLSVRNMDADDLRSADINMGGDDDCFMPNPPDDFSD